VLLEIEATEFLLMNKSIMMAAATRLPSVQRERVKMMINDTQSYYAEDES
jgi:hypothetical protein